MKTKLDRTEFLRALGRGGLLLGLGGAGLAALHGEKSPEECINTGQCVSCKAHGVCQLPEKKEAARDE